MVSLRGGLQPDEAISNLEDCTTVRDFRLLRFARNDTPTDKKNI